MPYADGHWQPPTLDVVVEDLDSRTRLLLPRGELDLATTPVLEEALRAEVDAGTKRIVLDLAGVPFMDSTGMAAIAEWRDRLIEAGGAFAVVTVDSQHRRLFHLTALTERLRVSGTRDEAVTALDEAGSADERADRSA